MKEVNIVGYKKKKLSFFLWFSWSNVCVHARSLQSCPTLCNLMDCILPGFSVHGILQARKLEWVDHALLQGIFLTQGLNQHRQADSLLLTPSRKPHNDVYPLSVAYQIPDISLWLNKSYFIWYIYSMRYYKRDITILFYWFTNWGLVSLLQNFTEGDQIY